MEDKPPSDRLVSVVIPTHNRIDLLERAVQSVLKQSWPNIEIVIIDDGSKDETAERIKALSQKNTCITYLRNETPQGACVARNIGIEAARGKYIALLDDDDEYVPKAIETLLQTYISGDYSFVCSDLKIISKSGNRRSSKAGRIDLDKILWINCATMSMITEKEKLILSGMFDKNLKAAQDYDLWIRLIKKYGLALRIPDVLYIYHQEHESQRITTVSSNRFKGYFDNYLKHRQLMHRRQRAYQLFRFMKLSGHNITLCHFLKMVPKRFYLLEFNDFLMQKTSIYQLLTRNKSKKK